MQQADEEELSLEELEKLQPVFTTIFICLQIVLMLGLVYSGWKNFSWFLAIPIGAVLWISNRILKRIFRQSFEEAIPIARLREAETKAVETRSFDSEPEDAIAEVQQKHAVINSTKKTPRDILITKSMIVLALFFAAVLPAALWYGIGLGVAAIFR